MIPYLAAQAVHIKMKFQPYTALISDYEYAYAVGLAAKFFGLPEPAYTTLPELKEAITPSFASLSSDDILKQNLLEMIREYKLQETTAQNQTSSQDILTLLHIGYFKEIN